MASNITVTVSKTVQEQQYEPLRVEMTITEPCTKANYNTRLEELTTLLSDEIYTLLGIGNGDEEAEEELGEEAASENTAPPEEEPGGDSFDDFFNEDPDLEEDPPF